MYYSSKGIILEKKMPYVKKFGAVLVSGSGPPTNTKMCCVSVKL